MADKLEFIRRKFEEDEVDFDFFRFRAVRKKAFSDELKRKIRLKFRFSLSQFLHDYKQGKADLPKPLKLIKEFQAKRQEEKDKLENLKHNLREDMR